MAILRRPARLPRKIALYANELKFASQAPKSLGQRLRLISATAGFHLRNWRDLAAEQTPQLTLDLNCSGNCTPVTLRPRDGDLAILYEVLSREAYFIPDEWLPAGSVKTIVDAGANIGFSAIYLARRYRAATVIAIEPNPDNFALLERNTIAEPRIQRVQACLTAETAQTVFIEAGGRGSHHKMNRSGSGHAVAGISVNELCQRQGLDTIDLLKLDIEGAEREIFAKADFLPRVRTVIAEIHGSYDVAAFNADLSPWGFSARQSPFADDPNLVIATRTGSFRRA